MMITTSTFPVEIVSGNEDTNTLSKKASNISPIIKNGNDGKIKKEKTEYVWRNIILLSILHINAVYAIYLALFVAQWKTTIFMFMFTQITVQGITSGVHRLWTHRTYKAKLPLRIFLMILQTMLMQTNIYDWARDHRVHHKYTETNADPHNAKRGFFFSHVGWLLVKKHKDVIVKGKEVDMSDILADPVVQFQIKYYFYMIPIISIAFPLWIPVHFLGESVWISYNIWIVMRYTAILNFTWLVNSASHIYGYKPYDKTIGPTENYLVSFVASGEGWHNYHHVYPWDYKAAELGSYTLNYSTMFIDVMAKFGLAYDLKTASPEMIAKRMQRTGDGSKVPNIKSKIDDDIDDHNEKIIWGWGDTDMKEKDRRDVKIYNALKED